MINIDQDFRERYIEAANNLDKATRFWNTYNSKPFDLLNNQQYWQLRTRLFELLNYCKTLDRDAFEKIHKGHPYYFIGISSFLMDDYQTAIYFFDAAFTEDASVGAHPINNPTPATRFMMQEGSEERQGAKIITEISEAKIERVMNFYLTQISKDPKTRAITKEILRNDFIIPCLTNNIRPGLRTLFTAFITFCVEWDFRKDHFEYGVKQGSSEPFLSHLFRGCVLFESLLKHNPASSPKEKVLGKILKEPEIQKALQISHLDTRESTLDDVYREVTKVVTIEQAIQVTYMTRNTLGHNLGWDSNISQDQYQNLYFVIAASCLHVIACLWK